MIFSSLSFPGTLWSKSRSRSRPLSRSPLSLQLPCHEDEGKVRFMILQQQLVGGFNPVEKCVCQIGLFPQVQVKIKHVFFKHHLGLCPVPTQKLRTYHVDHLALRLFRPLVGFDFGRDPGRGQAWQIAASMESSKNKKRNMNKTWKQPHEKPWNW